MPVATPGLAPSRDNRPSHETIVGMAAGISSLTGRAVIVVCVTAALAVTLAVPVRELISQRSQIAELQAEVDASEVRVDDLTARVADWNDPAYVAAQARSRLHFVYPGEVGYVVLGADDRPLVVEAAPVDQPAAAPWFATVWQSMESADSGVTSDAPEGSDPAEQSGAAESSDAG